MDVTPEELELVKQICGAALGDKLRIHNAVNELDRRIVVRQPPRKLFDSVEPVPPQTPPPTAPQPPPAPPADSPKDPAAITPGATMPSKEGTNAV